MGLVLSQVADRIGERCAQEWVVSTGGLATVTVTFESSGPVISPAAGCDWETLAALGHALVDAARAVRAGDDPGEVARTEWQRRVAKHVHPPRLRGL